MGADSIAPADIFHAFLSDTAFICHKLYWVHRHILKEELLIGSDSCKAHKAFGKGISCKCIIQRTKRHPLMVGHKALNELILSVPDTVFIEVHRLIEAEFPYRSHFFKLHKVLCRSSRLDLQCKHGSVGSRDRRKASAKFKSQIGIPESLVLIQQIFIEGIIARFTDTPRPVSAAGELLDQDRITADFKLQTVWNRLHQYKRH